MGNTAHQRCRRLHRPHWIECPAKLAETYVLTPYAARKLIGDLRCSASRQIRRSTLHCEHLLEGARLQRWMSQNGHHPSHAGSTTKSPVSSGTPSQRRPHDKRPYCLARCRVCQRHCSAGKTSELSQSSRKLLHVELQTYPCQ